MRLPETVCLLWASHIVEFLMKYCVSKVLPSSGKGKHVICWAPHKQAFSATANPHPHPLAQKSPALRIGVSKRLQASWNVMAHAQKPVFVFRKNGRVHLNRRGRQFSRLLAAEVCTSAVVMLDIPCSEVVWGVLATHSNRQFPLHFPSRASQCAITFNPLTPNDPYRGRTAPLTSKVAFYIFIQQI